MTPRIEIINEKKLVGKRLTMSFADYKIGELWRSFTPRRKEITNNLTTDLISMVVYKSTHFANFKPTNEFERWATVEVSDFNKVPNEMEIFVLPGGLYAVFDYKGLNTDNSIFQYILGTWLPSSDYVLDDRPHFETLGDNYKNNDPISEEEIWIPIKLKNTSHNLENNDSAQQQNSIQMKKNNKGLPDHLKSGIEDLSGIIMDDVKVHYNSDKPTQLQAQAYTQGTDIHIAPGQEKHLPHESWHVVQQKQGRVKPTRQMKGNVNITEDTYLEKEADVMGAKAMQNKST